MSKIINSNELTKKDLPNVDANWDEISEFALSFNPQLELGTIDIYNVENTKFSEESSVQDLRLSLFLWQRWWNSRLKEINVDGLNNLRKIIDLLRLKLEK